MVERDKTIGILSPIIGETSKFLGTIPILGDIFKASIGFGLLSFASNEARRDAVDKALAAGYGVPAAIIEPLSTLDANRLLDGVSFAQAIETIQRVIVPFRAWLQLAINPPAALDTEARQILLRNNGDLSSLDALIRAVQARCDIFGEAGNCARAANLRFAQVYPELLNAHRFNLEPFREGTVYRLDLLITVPVDDTRQILQRIEGLERRVVSLELLASQILAARAGKTTTAPISGQTLAVAAGVAGIGLLFLLA